MMYLKPKDIHGGSGKKRKRLHYQPTHPPSFFFHSQAPPTHMHMDRWIVELYYRRKYSIKIMLAKNKTIEK